MRHVALYFFGMLFGTFIAVAAEPARLTETDHCRVLAPKYQAQTEYRLWDGTRVDLYTEAEAIEVDYAKKWAECYGQAEYYGIVSGKRPAMLLLVANMEAERQFVYRAQTLAAAHEPEPMRLYIERID